MADEKAKQAWWSDTKSNLLTNPPKKFGDEVTDLFDDDRLSQLEKVGKVSFEQPETEEKADLSKTAALEKALKEAEAENLILKKELANVPKNVTAANKEIKKLEKELKDLKESRLKAPNKDGK